MKLPVPIYYKDSVFTDCETVRPLAYVLADAKKIIDSTGNPFHGMKTFLSGIITEFKSEESTVTDSVAIRTLVPHMPLKSAEFVSLMAAISLADDDGIEGCYPCPRCGKKIVKEKRTIHGEDVDTREFLSTFETVYEEERFKAFSFEEPVKITNLSNGSIIDEIASITMRHPTLEHTVLSMDQYGVQDKVRAQLHQYSQAITHVNGNEVDGKWRAKWGMYVLEHVSNVRKDVGQIADWILRSGIQSKKVRVCSDCGKEWTAYVDTTNFFVSGLQ